MRRTVLVTGATGNMGRAVVDALLAKPGLSVRLLVRPEERKHPFIRKWRRRTTVDYAWGDLTDAAAIDRAVEGVDVVLHMGALVSPLADALPPAVVERVNVGGTRNVVDAVKRLPHADRVRLVYVGTMAQTGSRNPPIHWGRAGDPISIGHNGHYAGTKAKGEAIVAESGLPHWVSIRQTGMAHYDMWRTKGPIIFHNPPNGVMEWSTVEDSARLMVALCGDDIPDGFWRHFYNIGGGAAARLVNHELMVRTMTAIGASDFRRLLDPRWLATRNFHGQWFIDSDRLHELVPYRRTTIDEFFMELPRHVPWPIRAVMRLLPGLARKQIRKTAEAPGGPIHWLRHNDIENIDAYFGSRDEWERIPESWDDFVFAQPSRDPVPLLHGYDDAKPKGEWTVEDLRSAAAWRGGACHAEGELDPYRPVGFRCSLGHQFDMSPNLYLAGGHWCPTCQTDFASYPRVGETSPFFAQIWPGPSADPSGAPSRAVRSSKESTIMRTTTSRLSVILTLVLISASTVSQRAAATPPQRAVSGKAPAKVAVPLYTTAKTPIGTLLDDPAARVIVDRHIPNTSTDRRIYFARKFTLKAIQPMSHGNITDRQLAAIDAELARLRRR